MSSKLNQGQPILISLSPNVEKDDIRLALKLLFCPWKWNQGRAVHDLRDNLSRYLGVENVACFNSGRTAFWAILKALDAQKGSEVFVQAFTCNAVVNPIKEAGLKPVFVDIAETALNMDPAELEKKVVSAKKPAVVLVQHTFGQPADLDKIQAICQKYNLILIEDCAHCLGAEYQGRKLGTFGQAAFFSFGRDKVISSVFGGAAVTNDPGLARKIAEIRQSLTKPSFSWMFQQLLHPILTGFFVVPLYAFGDLGKFKLIALQKMGLLSKAVTDAEKRGRMPEGWARQMPQGLALLAQRQLDKLDRILDHQKEIASFYRRNIKNPLFSLPPGSSGRIYMRFPVLANSADTDRILNAARKQKIFLDDGWRKAVIVPPDTDQRAMNYETGSCPRAEKASQQIVNLPTHINITPEKAQRIIDFLNNYQGGN